MQPAIEMQIDAMTRRIVEQFDPHRIILFGSHARGTAGPYSDTDLLVVLPIPDTRRSMRLKIRLALRGFRVAKDVIVTTPEDCEWCKDVVGTLEWPASREERVLHVRG